jgi:hypothetical protein
MTSDVTPLMDLDAARQDGEAFGRSVGKATAAEMTLVSLDPEQVSVVGVQGVDRVMARAEWLANGTADRVLVEAWTEAAAKAFNQEVDRAIALLTAAPVVDLKH